MMPQKHIANHYEACFRRHGDTPQGVDWPNEADARTRYRVMLGVVGDRSGKEPASLLDFGCGTAALLEFIHAEGIGGIDYAGLDISEAFVEASRAKFPYHGFYQVDLLADPDALPEFDYIVMNGVFTEKLDIGFDEMLDYMGRLLEAVFRKCRVGLAFNVMSKHVDWERDDLFHVPFDTMAALLKQRLSRHVVFRADYGLYEYTVYVYQQPTLAPSS